MENNSQPILPECDDSLYMNVRNNSEVQPCTPQLDDFSTWFGLAINGPKEVTFDQNPSGNYHAIIAGLCSLPLDWSNTNDRLWLIFERLDNGKKFTNSVIALDQINGISISRSFSPPSNAPYLTPELLEKASKAESSIQYPNPNFSLIGLPEGTNTYKVYMTLDGLKSNEIKVTVTVPKDYISN